MNMTFKEMIDALEQVDCDNRGSQMLVNEVIDALRLKDIVNVGRIREERSAPVEPLEPCDGMAAHEAFSMQSAHDKWMASQPAQGERQPYAWQFKCDGEINTVYDKAVADRWEKQGFKVTPLFRA